MISEILKDVADWYLANINYASITVLMAIKSSFIPFPSEIVVPPAAWKAAQGKLSIGLVLLFSTLGALIGAILNYYCALYLGRRLLYRLAGTRAANMILVNEAGIGKSEEFFRKHGPLSTFIGRLIPAIRQLISLPAGLARMNMASFLFYTTLGAGLWNIILALLGFFLYTQHMLLERYYNAISYVFIVMGGVGVCVLLAKRLRHKKGLLNRCRLERTRKIASMDRSNYFKRLPLLIRKDRKTTQPESDLLMHIGSTLDFEKKFCMNAIAEIQDNAFIVDEPPLFSTQAMAMKFIKDGLSLVCVDDELHPREEQWLRSIVEKNGLAPDFFLEEIRCARR